MFVEMERKDKSSFTRESVSESEETGGGGGKSAPESVNSGKISNVSAPVSRPTRFSVSSRPSPRTMSLEEITSRVKSNTVISRLSEMDKDGDGVIDADELLDFVTKEVQQGKDLAIMKKITKALIIAGIVMTVIILIIISAVVQLSKDTSMENGKMVVKGTDVLVETASADTQVLGSTLQNKAGETLAVGLASKKLPLSSALPDATFSELRVLVLTSPSGAHLQLNILGFVRLPNLGIQCGSLVKLFTAPGAVILDGDQITFDDSLGPVFQEAGFTMSVHVTGRRLLQMAELTGIFNLISKLDDHDVCNSTSVANPLNAARRSLQTLSDSYHIDMVGWIPCRVPDDEWCKAQGATTFPAASGSFFTKNVSLWRNSKTGSSKLLQSVSWDPLARITHQVYSPELGATRSVQVVGDESYECVLQDTPPMESMFDNLDPANAQIRKTSIPEETMFAFAVQSTGAPLELRVTMNDKTGALVRVQVWDLHQAANTSSELFSSQQFWQIKSAQSVTVFPHDLFKPAFPDGCTANKTISPLPPRPCSAVSPERQQWDQANRNFTFVPDDSDAISTVQDTNGTLPINRRRLLSYWSHWGFPGKSKTMKALLPVSGGFWWNSGDRKFTADIEGRGTDSPIPGFSVTGKISVGWNYPSNGPNAKGCIQVQVGGKSKVVKPAVDFCESTFKRSRCEKLFSYTIGEVCMPTIRGWNYYDPIQLAKVGKSVNLGFAGASAHVIVTGYFAPKPAIEVKLALAVDMIWPASDWDREINILRL